MPIHPDNQNKNMNIYLAIFYGKEQTVMKTIYELESSVVKAETERQLDTSCNDISHIGFTEKWARENGKIVYSDT